MEKKMKFKGMKVTITTERIAEDNRDPDLFYYEIVADPEQTHIPLMIVEESEGDFWGTMICEEEFEMNNGEFHSISTDLGIKLATAFDRMPQ